jgi:hypothetical protein
MLVLAAAGAAASPPARVTTGIDAQASSRVVAKVLHGASANETLWRELPEEKRRERLLVEPDGSSYNIRLIEFE